MRLLGHLLVAADVRDLLVVADADQVVGVGDVLVAPGQQGRPLRLLHRRHLLLRADLRRRPRPGADRRRRMDAFNELVRRFPDSDYARDAKLKLDLATRPPGRQGDGDRPLLPRTGKDWRGGDQPLPQRGRALPDHDPRARGAGAAGRVLPGAGPCPRRRSRRPPCWATTSPAATGTSAPTRCSRAGTWRRSAGTLLALPAVLSHISPATRPETNPADACCGPSRSATSC